MLEAGPGKTRCPEFYPPGMAAGNVAYGGTVNPPRNRKGGAGNPPPTGARASALPDNPFVPVIITTWEPDQDLVEKIAGCGADALLVKPFAPKQLINRIEYLAHKRKPFVVTSEYIGPDRRKDTSRQSKIPLIDVPNTLRDKVHGVGRDPAALQLEIDAALTRVNEEKLSRHAFQIGFLVGLIRPSFEDDELDELCSEHIDRLVFVAQDVKRRMLGTKYEHVSELCQSLIRLAGGIQENFPKSNEKEMELLKQLSDAVLIGFHPDNDAAAMAEEITSSINVFEAKKGRQAPTCDVTQHYDIR